jgi:hypothetical protein
MAGSDERFLAEKIRALDALSEFLTLLLSESGTPSPSPDLSPCKHVSTHRSSDSFSVSSKDPSTASHISFLLLLLLLLLFLSSSFVFTFLAFIFTFTFAFTFLFALFGSEGNRENPKSAEEEEQEARTWDCIFSAIGDLGPSDFRVRGCASLAMAQEKHREEEEAQRIRVWRRKP